jgi:hypothetical protein
MRLQPSSVATEIAATEGSTFPRDVVGEGIAAKNIGAVGD